MFNLQFLSIAISGLVTISQAIELQALPPTPKPASLVRRQQYGADYSCLELQSEETFTWGAGDASSNAVLGQLKISMPGEAENILSMERFSHLIASVNCTNTSMDITFTNDDTFSHAQAVWDWVNRAGNHSFVLVAGSGDCGWNDHRVPFTVFEIEYREEANSVHLNANASEWKDAVHTFTLDVGHMKTTPAGNGIEARDVHDKDISIDFNHQFPINYTSLSVPPVGIALSCSPCGTSGQFVVSFHMETMLGVPKDLTVGLQPRGVSMDINPAISLSVDVGPTLAKEFELFAIPLDAIVIPGGVMNIGLSIPFAVGVSMGPLSIAGSISTSINIAIPDNSSLILNVLEPDVQTTGWDPVVTTGDIVLSSRLAGAVRAYAKVGPALDLEALGTGGKIAATIGPMIQARAEAVGSTGAACANDPQKRHFAVDLNPTYGIVQNIGLSASVAGVSETLLGTETGLWIQQLPIVCYPFGEADNITNTINYDGDRPAPSQTVTPSILSGPQASVAYASEIAQASVPVETAVPVQSVVPES